MHSLVVMTLYNIYRSTSEPAIQKLVTKISNETRTHPYCQPGVILRRETGSYSRGFLRPSGHSVHLRIMRPLSRVNFNNRLNALEAHEAGHFIRAGRATSPIGHAAPTLQCYRTLSIALTSELYISFALIALKVS